MSALLVEEIAQDNSLFSIEDIKSGMSCDYITIYQEHEDYDGVIPKYDGGMLLNLDSTGYYTEEPLNIDSSQVFDGKKVREIDGDDYVELWKSVKKLQLKGSHNTSLMIFSDGRKVFLMGNVGRFGRVDNLFNLSFDKTLEKCNEIAVRLGLPPFTKGKSTYLDGKTVRHCGAVITRLDVNINIKTGSPQNAKYLIKLLSSRSMKYVGKKVYDSTVQFGKGRNVCKAYIKSQEMFDHLKGKKQDQKDIVLNSLAYKLAHDEGLVRFELQLDRKTLSETHLRDIENVKDERLAMALKDKIDQVFQKSEKKINKYTPLAIFEKKKHRDTINAWMMGIDLRDEFEGLSESTFYRHKREILAISGIDISHPFINIEESFGTAQLYQEIDLSIAKPPNDYQMGIDLSVAMPDIKIDLPMANWTQSDRKENVIDFHKYIKDQEKKTNALPVYYSLSNNGLSDVIKPIAQSHKDLRDQRIRESKYKLAKSKADAKRDYQMAKLYEIHKENKVRVK